MSIEHDKWTIIHKKEQGVLSVEVNDGIGDNLKLPLIFDSEVEAWEYYILRKKTLGNDYKVAEIRLEIIV